MGCKVPLCSANRLNIIIIISHPMEFGMSDRPAHKSELFSGSGNHILQCLVCHSYFNAG